MIKVYNNNIFVLEEMQGGVRLLRVFGETPEMTLPYCIEDRKIIEIGDYCFAAKARLSSDIMDEIEKNGLGDGNIASDSKLKRPICGDFLQKIELSSAIVAIGDYAFYGCRCLEEISVESGLTNIGSDIFMNCKNLKRLIIKARVNEKSILQKLLSQISREIEVSFVICSDENPGLTTCQAKVLYPMFTESYELLGPAHIFGLNLEGEGYRARKQFKDDCIDLMGYDQIFTKASHEEAFTTIVRMAIDRLAYPYDLSDDAKKKYECYLREHEEQVLKNMVERGEADEIMSILKSGLISPLGKKAAIETAVAMGKLDVVNKLITI